jgi:hypothetical protein
MSNIGISQSSAVGSTSQQQHAKPAVATKVAPKLSNPSPRFESEVERIKATLSETREGATMFETTKQKVCLPRNWTQLVETHNLFLVADQCIRILGYERINDEAEWSDNMSQNADFTSLVDGLLYSLTEISVNKSNFATTSKLEIGRIEGQTRRALTMCAKAGMPYKWTRQAKAPCVATGSATDTLYKAILPNINSRHYAIKICAWVVRLYNAAQGQLVSNVTFDISDFNLSFDEVWTRIGDIKKDNAGRIKYDKAGNPKRYHPSIPDFGGMSKDEVIACKQYFGPSWSTVQSVRSAWADLSDKPKEYENMVKFLQGTYSHLVKAAKSVKAYADARVEALGLPRTAAKATITSRINQRKAEEKYEPKYTLRELAIIARTSISDIVRSGGDLSVGDVLDGPKASWLSSSAAALLKETPIPSSPPRRPSQAEVGWKKV